MSRDILLEIGTEEMPAKFMPGIVEEIRELAATKLKDAKISFEKITVYATPRRMTFIAEKAAETQADEQVKKRGPSIKAAFDEAGNPTKAVCGFARGMHMDPAELSRDGEYVWAEMTVKGKPVTEVLPGLFKEFITSMTFPKSMRWGEEEMRFVRPIRWIVALCGNEIVPFEIAGVRSGRMSRGHRVLAKGDAEITSPAEYKEKLAEVSVMADQAERREVIRSGLEKLAAQMGGTVRHDEDLLEEITYLVEYPTPLCGRIDEEFLKLPEPAIITPMKDHQRYYPLRGKDGKLLPLFLTVRNGGKKALEKVQIGNERVLRARLDDAKFFFEEDRKKTLEERREDLKRINYQEGLGSLLDKADRLVKIAAMIAEDWNLSEEETADAKRAAYLSKSDLATGMVTEFTELEGEMGKEYALLDGERPAAAQAIFEQYMPRFAGDILPQGAPGRALSLADKLDNIAATFSRGLIPTGSQDPFALRRQTIGAVNILVSGKIHWSLHRGLEKALELLPVKESEKGELTKKMEEFFRQRIRSILLDSGIPYDIVDAVTGGPIDDIYSVFLRAGSMNDCHIQAETDLRQAMTRLANITKGKTAGTVSEELFENEQEKDLWVAYQTALPAVKAAYEAYEYSAALPALRTLVDPINRLLDSTMIMVEDEKIRGNRISLLIRTCSLTKEWGDFDKLV